MANSASIVFHKIAIVAQTHASEARISLLQLIDLLNKLQRSIVCETETASLIADKQLPTVEYAELGKDVDLVIAIGGDGTMLRAAKVAAQYGTPVIGINRGRLGFLTDIRPSDINTQLAAVLNGEYEIGERSFLQTQIASKQPSKSCDKALNDVVLSPGRTPHMLEFEIYVDDEFVCSHRADGLIVATPTGSTAYALSGGGPILHPVIDALVILPMFSHTLSSRPIVVPGKSEIKIILSPNNATDSQLSCDGGDIILVPPGGTIEIKKDAQTIRFIHPRDYNYYAALRGKLQWGKQLTPDGEPK